MPEDEPARQAALKLSRRRFLQNTLVAGAVVAGVPAPPMAGNSSVGPTVPATSGTLNLTEDIRCSQYAVLAPTNGQVEKLQMGVKAFLDSNTKISSALTWQGMPTFPIELQGRSFIRSSKSGVEAVCKQAGYVYVVTASNGPEVSHLLETGFKQLDFPEFQVFDNDTTTRALAYQKLIAEGESLQFGSWVILIFGPEERGAVPYSKMRPLDPPVFLPDGSEFKTWEAPLKFSKTYYVNQSHPQASNDNPGTKERPYKTINHAAQLLQPGERVVVEAGVYRECVRPARGGTDPEQMISYEAAAGASVVIKGSEILKSKWVKSPAGKGVWMNHLAPELFVGYNPFGTANYRQLPQLPYWNLPEVFRDPRATLYLLVCGLLFQNGQRLRQVSTYEDLFNNPESFWVEIDGLTLHVNPFGGENPNEAVWEATTREQIFAPEKRNLGYIRVKGFKMQYAANPFPFPQRGAISTTQGHHWIIEDNTLEWVNSVGIDIGDQAAPAAPRPELLGYHIVRRNVLNDIGTTGITGPAPRGSLIDDNVFRRNAWQDIECLAECAAIKTHHNLCVLVRRNLVLDTVHGTGIYMDSNNSNSRICQNLVANTGSSWPPVRGLGGIYLEATMFPNMVDHNIVWGSTHSNGLFDFSISKLIAAHNLIGDCSEAGIMIIDTPGRKSGSGADIPVGNNRVFENVLVNNGWNIMFYSPNNFSDYNLFGKARHSAPFHLLGTGPNALSNWEKEEKDEKHDLSGWQRAHGLDVHSSEGTITADFNPETLELTLSVEGDFSSGPRLEGMDRDFWGRPIAGKAVVPGPFGSIPKEATRIVVDPRPSRK